MKKIIGSLAILVTVLGMTSVSMAKSYADVKGTKCEEAVDILSDLKIISGYEDGKYKPNNSVKRSEMAKLITVALGKEKTAETLEGSTTFSDVKASHWASGYINLASSLGLIKGYPDGTFRPDATVSYVEASTMLLRALDYGKELDNLSWPTGYMTKANTAGLLKNVTASSSSDAAIRGNVANMILNTLKGNVRKVVASNDNGNIYGDADILMEKSFSHLTYVEKGIVTDIDIEDLELTVEDEEKDREIKVLYTNTSDIKTLFGREVSFIYDEEAEDFLSFELLDELTVKEITVDEIDEDEYIVIDEDGNEYDMPKSSNMLMFGTENYSEVKKAYITLDSDKKVTHMILEGVEKLYIGIVSQSSITVNNKKGIEVRNVEGDYEKLVLASTSVKFSKGDVVFYTFNKDDKAVIKSKKDVDDAYKIESVSSDSIELKNKDEIEFEDDDEYVVYVARENSLEIQKLTYIDKTYDLASIYEYADMHYIVVFINSVDEDDIETNISVSSAKSTLNSVLKKAKKKTEESYSVVSFERLKDAIAAGDKIYSSASSYSVAKIQLATRDIEDALATLVAAKTEDKELRKSFSALTSKLAEAKKLNSSDYTADSYKALSTAITNADRIEIDYTTVAKITTATKNLTDAMSLLVTNASASQIKEATARLDKAIADATAKKAVEYSSESFKELTETLANAKKLDRTTAGARGINTVASNLEAAIDALVPVKYEAYTTARKTLDDNMKTAMDKNEAAYTVDSWTTFEELRSAIRSEYLDLKDKDEVRALSNINIATETDKVKVLDTRIKAALEKLVLKTDDTLRKNSLKKIQNSVDKVATLDETTWNEAETSAITWAALQEKIKRAKEMLANPDNYTTKQLSEVANDLELYIVL